MQFQQLVQQDLLSQNATANNDLASANGNDLTDLTSVKLLFLSLQFAQGLKALKQRNPVALSAVQCHLAVVLAR